MPSDPTAAIRPRRRYHFGSPGVVYIFVTLLLVLGALNSQNNLLFWAFGFSLAILVVSGILSGAMLMGVDIRRERVPDAEVGGPVTIRYRIRNRNRLVPAFALTIEELPATPSRNRDAAPLTPATTSRLEQPRAFVAHVGPRESLTVRATPRAVRRGPIAFRGFVVHTSFPFGLIRKSLVYDEPASAVIRPAPASGDVPALTEAISAGQSERTGRTRGPGDEFHSLREYSPGDNPRSIAWKASARRGVLLVRQSLAPSPQRLWVVLRLRIDSDNADALDERAISIAAAVIRKAAARGLAVGLAVPVARVLVPPNAHPGHADRLMRELGLLELGPVDARGLHESFPHVSSSRDAGQCVCIHGGAADPAFAPGDSARRPIHISASSLPASPPSFSPAPSHLGPSIVSDQPVGAPA